MSERRGMSAETLVCLIVLMAITVGAFTLVAIEIHDLQRRTTDHEQRIHALEMERKVTR